MSVPAGEHVDLGGRRVLVLRLPLEHLDEEQVEQLSAEATAVGERVVIVDSSSAEAEVQTDEEQEAALRIVLGEVDDRQGKVSGEQALILDLLAEAGWALVRVRPGE